MGNSRVERICNGKITSLIKKWNMECGRFTKKKKPIRCKWVFTDKAFETIEHYKTRLITKRFTQTYGLTT